MKNFKASANGRVNLIGEHTDYNGGFVLPTAIPQKTTVSIHVRNDQMVTAKTAMRGQSTEPISYQLGDEKPAHRWLDYVQGTTLLLGKAGVKFGGFDLEIDSSVPTGSGLSSSAALEISLLKGLQAAFGFAMSESQMALLGQKVENEFVGAQVGIMDQMACAHAQFGEALFLDTKTLAFERIAIPLDEIDLIVMNSGVEHRHSNGDYNQRRRECNEACDILKIKELREFGPNDLGRLDTLPDVLRRRARHVITENARVLQAVSALREKNVEALGELFYASHSSMRDDYEVSIPEIDLLVDLCRQESATIGARLTGGGFGGSIVAITRRGEGLNVARAVSAQYERKTAQRATTLVPLT